jgi:putative flippase GtrA
VRLVQDLRNRLIPERYHSVVGEIGKFGAVGLVNTALDYAVLNLLLSVGPLKAKVAATVVATTASYFMNRHWTFNTRDRAGLRREYALFFALNLVGMVIQLAVLGVAKYGLGFTEHGGGDDRLAFNLFNALGIAVAMVFRFWAYRAFVFKAAPVVSSDDAVVTADEMDEFEVDLASVEVALTDVAVAPAPRAASEEVSVR